MMKLFLSLFEYSVENIHLTYLEPCAVPSEFKDSKHAYESYDPHDIEPIEAMFVRNKINIEGQYDNYIDRSEERTQEFEFLRRWNETNGVLHCKPRHYGCFDAEKGVVVALYGERRNCSHETPYLTLISVTQEYTSGQDLYTILDLVIMIDPKNTCILVYSNRNLDL